MFWVYTGRGAVIRNTMRHAKQTYKIEKVKPKEEPNPKDMDRKTRFGLKLYEEEDLDIYVETRS